MPSASACSWNTAHLSSDAPTTPTRIGSAASPLATPPEVSSPPPQAVRVRAAVAAIAVQVRRLRVVENDMGVPSGGGGVGHGWRPARPGCRDGPARGGVLGASGGPSATRRAGAASSGRRGRCGAGLPAGHDGVRSRTFARCARHDSTTCRRRTLRSGSWWRRGSGSCRHHEHADAPRANLRAGSSIIWTRNWSHGENSSGGTGRYRAPGAAVAPVSLSVREICATPATA